MLDALLVPLDGSHFSEHTLPLAAALSRSSGATLHLAHVHRDHPPVHLLANTQFHFEGLDLEEYEERHRVEERDYLSGVAEKMKEETGLEPEQVLLEGEIVDALEGHARDIGARLILMTTHGRTGVSRAWLGSVADVLVRQTHLPVLLVRPAEGGNGAPAILTMKHLLVPLDGSELSERILPAVLEVARAMGSRVTLMSVVQPVVHVAARSLPLPAAHVEERKAKAMEYLGQVAESLRREDIDTAVRVVADTSPAAAVLSAVQSEGADLVAMCTHGHAGFTRAVLGSVADKVLRASPVPVLLERPLMEALG